MSQKILLMSAALLLMLNAPSMGQEKKDSPASPSDISVDQIKKETAKADPTKSGSAKDGSVKDSSVQEDTPKPVAEGTPVAQPACQTSGCECDPCNSCQKRCRRGLFSRLRMRMSRGCGGCGCN